MELESEWNRTNIFWGGIGIGIELNIIGPESELNRNRPLPELHIIDGVSGWRPHLAGTQQYISNGSAGKVLTNQHTD